MFGGIGMQEILVILFIFLLVFGAKRLPELGQALGKGIREFKRSVSEIEDNLKEERPRPPAIREEPPAIAPQSGAGRVEIQDDSRAESKA